MSRLDTFLQNQRQWKWFSESVILTVTVLVGAGSYFVWRLYCSCYANHSLWRVWWFVILGKIGLLSKHLISDDVCLIITNLSDLQWSVPWRSTRIKAPSINIEKLQKGGNSNYLEGINGTIFDFRLSEWTRWNKKKDGLNGKFKLCLSMIIWNRHGLECLRIWKLSDNFIKKCRDFLGRDILGTTFF